jgi:hypothetical protein
MFRSQGVPLNEAIKQLAAQHPELNNEHVKRVVEFANNVTFQAEFQQNTDKNVNFPIADPGVILRDLKDGGSPAFDGKTLDTGMGDYKMAPQGNAGANGADQQLNALFQPEAQPGAQDGVKMASLRATDHSGHANPIEDVYDEQVRLQAAREKVAEAHETFDQMLTQAREDLYLAVKGEVIDADGAGLGGAIGALEKLAGEEMTASLMEPIIIRLVHEGINDLPRSLEKRAGAYMNPEHPLAQAWAGMVRAAEEQVKSAEALDQLDAAIEKCAEFISKSAGAVTTAVRKATGVGHGKVPTALRQRFSKAR